MNVGRPPYSFLKTLLAESGSVFKLEYVPFETERVVSSFEQWLCKPEPEQVMPDWGPRP
jgi:hypothetical protein